MLRRTPFFRNFLSRQILAQDSCAQLSALATFFRVIIVRLARVLRNYLSRNKSTHGHARLRVAT
jgi:hypothetical protein